MSSPKGRACYFFFLAYFNIRLQERLEMVKDKVFKYFNISDIHLGHDKNKAEKAKSKPNKEKYLKKVEEWEIELQMIKTKFNFSDKK